MAHEYVASFILDARELENLRLDEEAPSVHTLYHTLIRLQHLDELFALFNLDRGICAPCEAHLAICFKVVDDLVCQSDEATLLGHQVHDLLTSNIKHNKHGLVRVDGLDFVLTA